MSLMFLNTDGGKELNISEYFEIVKVIDSVRDSNCNLVRVISGNHIKGIGCVMVIAYTLQDRTYILNMFVKSKESSNRYDVRIRFAGKIIIPEVSKKLSMDKGSVVSEKEDEITLELKDFEFTREHFQKFIREFNWSMTIGAGILPYSVEELIT